MAAAFLQHNRLAQVEFGAVGIDDAIHISRFKPIRRAGRGNLGKLGSLRLYPLSR